MNMGDLMPVVLRDREGQTVAFGVVDVDDGYDGTPIVEWEGRHFTPSAEVVAGSRIYIERRVRKVVSASGEVWPGLGSPT
jgi:hypothetical protein